MAVTPMSSGARRFALAALMAAAGLLAACATTHNYLDPSGPKYVGRFADPEPVRTRSAGNGAIKVVTFNIEYALRIDGALELLRDEPSLRAPDILCLQEMDTLGTQRIARALGMNYVYAPSGVHPKYKRDFGCAILSPWPLEDARKVLQSRKLVTKPNFHAACLDRAANQASRACRGLRKPFFSSRHWAL